MKIWNVIDVLDQAYVLAQQLGLAKSKAEFSAKLLGKGASYLTSMSTRDRCPSNDVLLALESKLLTLLATHNGTADCGMECGPVATQYYARLRRVFEFVKAARLVHEAFADNFYPANDNALPPHERSARGVALSYHCPDDELINATHQPRQMEAGR